MPSIVQQLLLLLILLNFFSAIGLTDYILFHF